MKFNKMALLLSYKSMSNREMAGIV